MGFLNGKFEAIGSFVFLQLEPVAALASLGLVLEDPEPLDVRVLIVAHAADLKYSFILKSKLLSSFEIYQNYNLFEK